ncbi:hypothetical protein BDN70DRAFT_689588 [Pholiota conissans]|uniref:Uncharacterized protein n=1 Tax=Pholiota conissans TaxID=109636 RepID=A0A9P5YK09_9AGAR|nr:hypothetical protein BDN70DRAFT_689588 [Pholiota conissans]
MSVRSCAYAHVCGRTRFADALLSLTRVHWPPQHAPYQQRTLPHNLTSPRSERPPNHAYEPVIPQPRTTYEYCWFVEHHSPLRRPTSLSTLPMYAPHGLHMSFSLHAYTYPS